MFSNCETGIKLLMGAEKSKALAFSQGSPFSFAARRGRAGRSVEGGGEIDHVLAQLEMDGVIVKASEEDIVGDARIGGLGLQVLLDRLADERQIAGARAQGLVVFSREQGLAEPGAGDQRDEGDEDGNGEERCGCAPEVVEGEAPKSGSAMTTTMPSSPTPPSRGPRSARIWVVRRRCPTR